MSPIFAKAIDRVLSHEGGYTNNPHDAGNWTGGKINSGVLKGTKFGISAGSYPNVDIKNLTREQACEIYYKDYWKGIKLDLLDPDLAFQIFDAAVQHGQRTAIKLLQQTVGTEPDGVIGIKTLNAINSKGAITTAVQYISTRIKYYTGMSQNNWARFGLGWMNRMALNIKYLSETIA